MNSKNMAVTAIVAVLILSTAALVCGEDNGIEGHWQVVSDEGGPGVIRIQSQADGTVTAFVIDENRNGAYVAIPLDEVTFEDGKFRFEVTSNEIIFEGTITEDGSTIEGQLQREGQSEPLVLKRMDEVPSEIAQAEVEPTQETVSDTDDTDAAPSETAQVPQEQPQDRTEGTSDITTTLILVLILLGIVGLVAIFFVKSSIR